MKTPKRRRDECVKLNRRFNWRGNRPRMGKRGMCGSCGCLIHIKVNEGDTCPSCGQPSMSDVSYED